jgi:hypothetical protein
LQVYDTQHKLGDGWKLKHAVRHFMGITIQDDVLVHDAAVDAAATFHLSVGLINNAFHIPDSPPPPPPRAAAPPGATVTQRFYAAVCDLNYNDLLHVMDTLKRHHGFGLRGRLAHAALMDFDLDGKDRALLWLFRIYGLVERTRAEWAARRPVCLRAGQPGSRHRCLQKRALMCAGP